jgi:hypothetical protein
MRELFEGFFAGLDEVLRFRTTIMVIIFGAVSIGIWTVIGGLFWPQLIAFTNQLIDWLPFAMLRSNGAWMLSTFLWLQAIMLTVALLSLLLTVTVYRKLPKEKYTSAAVLTVVGSTALWSVVWLFKGKAIYAAVLHWLTTLPFDTVETGVSWLLAFYILYNAVIVTMLFLTSAYTPILLRRVREAHYPYESIHIEAEMRSFGYTVRDTVLFAAGSLLLLPLLFIPVINVFTQMALWIWLVKDTFTYDVAALFYTKEEIEHTKRRNGMLWSIAAVTALFNFFPLINFAGPFVGEVMMFHYLVGLKSKQ